MGDSPQHRLKLIALLASIGGAIAFTMLAAAIAWVLWKGGWPVSTALARIDWLGWGMMAVAGGAIIAVLALGYVITPRRFRGNLRKGEVDFSGGEVANEQNIE